MIGDACDRDALCDLDIGHVGECRQPFETGDYKVGACSRLTGWSGELTPTYSESESFAGYVEIRVLSTDKVRVNVDKMYGVYEGFDEDDISFWCPTE